jgi:adenylate cyclase
LAAAVRRSFVAAVVASLVAACMWLLPQLQLLEERTRDALTSQHEHEAPLPHLVVVDIGEASLKKLGTWPWPRSRMADLIEELVGPLGARGVALDMVLPEAADATGDARLASLGKHAPVTFAQVLDFVDRGSGIAVGALAGGAPVPPGVHAPVATGFVANHAGMSDARCVGHISVRPDADGVVRRIALHAIAHERLYSTLSLALMECVQPQLAARAIAALGTHEGAAWRVPFRLPVAAFVTVPAEAILLREVDPAVIRGSYVLIGSSAVGLSDYVATPLQPVTAGVLVHAQAMGEFMQALDRPRAGGWLIDPRLLSVLALATGILALAAAFIHSLRTGLALLGLFAAGWLALCSALFTGGSAPSVLPPLAGAVAFAATWLGLDLAETRRASRRILDTLAHYVAEPVLRLLVRQGLERSLTPSRREITVLVADMAGYTRLTAESGLEDCARLTTEFLEAITHPVLRSAGTLDRYTGDGLIAFWGAPLSQPDHSQRAFAAALEMLAALEGLNAERARRGERPISMRIGIEAGEALVGDLGSSARSVYTAVGTCINVASRLQELAREHGEPLVVGPHARTGIAATLRSLGRIAVRGLPERIELFALALQPAAREVVAEPVNASSA